ncbi:phosphoribosyltransferase [Mucisphaera calidilacus]|uniref:Hypoxanthine phosphoribosyltransferase n=1 Tax=Mucisphaera calidilacus TaxID=2527982 RepID=A0A518BZN0_9BACT|nr:phosphoribosyltransferase family protein [Mucisphaera calidilacus]QDU72424.1 Hypoxanthine phosphoribosyltransferase [Mucisphaera calidilacus]
MDADLETILIDEQQISRRLDDLAARMVAEVPREGGVPAEIVLIPIMTGALVFTADLIRRIPTMLCLHTVAISSYGRATQPGEASFNRELTSLPDDLSGRHVILVDDILDSGQTLKMAQAHVLERGPASMKTCVLLRKPTNAARAVPVEYVGFDIPDRFVVGYGLDLAGYYRNLPMIAVPRASVIERLVEPSATS